MRLNATIAILTALTGALLGTVPAQAQNPPVAQITPTYGAASLLHDPNNRTDAAWLNQFVGVVQMKMSYGVTGTTGAYTSWYGLDSWWYTYKVTVNYAINNPPPPVIKNYGPIYVQSGQFTFARNQGTTTTNTWDMTGIYNAVFRPWWSSNLPFCAEWNATEIYEVHPSYKYWKQYWNAAHTAQVRDYYRKDLAAVVFSFPTYTMWAGLANATPTKNGPKHAAVAVAPRGVQVAMAGDRLLPLSLLRSLVTTPSALYGGYYVTFPAYPQVDPIPGTDNTARFLYADQPTGTQAAALAADLSWRSGVGNGVLESTVTMPQSQWLAIP
jgi:hypothetical protein